MIGSANGIRMNFNGIILTDLYSFNVKNDVSQASVVALSASKAGTKFDGNTLVGQIEVQAGRGSKAYNTFDNYYKTLKTKSASEITTSRLTSTHGQQNGSGEIFISEMTNVIIKTRSDSTNSFEDNGTTDFLVTFVLEGVMPPEKRDIKISA